jgi:hypothetical protein
MSMGESGLSTMTTSKGGQVNRVDAELCRALALLIDSMVRVPLRSLHLAIVSTDEYFERNY